MDGTRPDGLDWAWDRPVLVGHLDEAQPHLVSLYGRAPIKLTPNRGETINSYGTLSNWNVGANCLRYYL